MVVKNYICCIKIHNISACFFTVTYENLHSMSYKYIFILMTFVTLASIWIQFDDILLHHFKKHTNTIVELVSFCSGFVSMTTTEKKKIINIIL